MERISPTHYRTGDRIRHDGTLLWLSGIPTPTTLHTLVALQGSPIRMSRPHMICITGIPVPLSEKTARHWGWWPDGDSAPGVDTPHFGIMPDGTVLQFLDPATEGSTASTYPPRHTIVISPLLESWTAHGAGKKSVEVLTHLLSGIYREPTVVAELGTPRDAEPVPVPEPEKRKRGRPPRTKSVGNVRERISQDRQAALGIPEAEWKSPAEVSAANKAAWRIREKQRDRARAIRLERMQAGWDAEKAARKEAATEKRGNP